MHEKIALITGASSGIGKNVAETLARNGYLVILTARRKDKLAELCTSIEKSGGKAKYYELDVTNKAQIKAVVDSIIAEYGRIDVLFNNAGVLAFGTSDVSTLEVKNVLDTNLYGAILVAQCVAMQMKTQKSGYIINLSSISGKMASADLGIYNASKFGLCGFNEALALEMAPFGVKVTAICPGFVATDMTTVFNFDQELMMPVTDISRTVEYLLNLSPNATLIEVVLNCAPFMARQSTGDTEVLSVR